MSPDAKAGLSLEELEALAGIPADVILQGINIGLYAHGWLVESDPPKFHPRTSVMLARTRPLLDKVAAGRLSLERFHDILWTIALAGPDRLVDYLGPPSNRAVRATLAGRSLK